MWVRSLGWEDALEEGVASYSNILAWKIPWTEEPGRLQSVGHKESDMTKLVTTHSLCQALVQAILCGLCTAQMLNQPPAE